VEEGAAAAEAEEEASDWLSSLGETPQDRLTLVGELAAGSGDRTLQEEEDCEQDGRGAQNAPSSPELVRTWGRNESQAKTRPTHKAKRKAGIRFGARFTFCAAIDLLQSQQ
jgi:hypothetical protein